MKIGESIRKIREFKGYKQETVAEHLKISQANYSKIESEDLDITLGRLKEIADFLNVSIENIIGFDKNSFFNNSDNSGNTNTVINDLKLFEEIIKTKDEVIKSQEKSIQALEFSISLLKVK